jgi:putative transposase
MTLSVAKKRMLIDPQYTLLPVASQCRLLELPRSSYYYQACAESPENLMLTHRIDEIYTKHPYFGVLRMTHWLRREGYNVNPKRIRRLMHRMGIHAVYPKKNLSQSNPGHRIYPYLLRGLQIEYPNQVWSTDITYIRLQDGFAYLVAVIDWFSRYVLSWELSNSLDVNFCLIALGKALDQDTPQIFNTDQGCQFTSNIFTKQLIDKEVKISMDGRGRALDNIFIERFWRSLKYEDIYLKGYETILEAYQGIRAYLDFYNNERQHQSLAYHTPAEIYYRQNLTGTEN